MFIPINYRSRSYGYNLRFYRFNVLNIVDNKVKTKIFTHKNKPKHNGKQWNEKNNSLAHYPGEQFHVTQIVIIIWQKTGCHFYESLVK